MGKRTLRTIETDIFGYKVAEDSINSKKKGDTNERAAANWLYQWTGEKFIRTPSSGGRRLENASNFCGDVVCENEDFKFPFAVETKHRKDITFSKVLRKNSIIYTIYQQAKEDAVRAKKFPMMMLRRDKMPKGLWVIFFNFEIKDLEPVSVGSDDSGDTLYGYDSYSILHKVKFVELIKIL